MQGFPELFEDTSEKKESKEEETSQEKENNKEDEPMKEDDTKGEESPPPGSEKWCKDSLTSGCGICEHIFVSKILLVPNLLVLGTDEVLQILMLFNQPISGFDYR